MRAAHLRAGGEAAAYCGATRVAEETAAVGLVELDAAHAGGLAALHAGNGAGDGRSDAAGGAGRAAFHRSGARGQRAPPRKDVGDLRFEERRLATGEVLPFGEEALPTAVMTGTPLVTAIAISVRSPAPLTSCAPNLLMKTSSAPRSSAPRTATAACASASGSSRQASDPLPRSCDRAKRSPDARSSSSMPQGSLIVVGMSCCRMPPSRTPAPASVRAASRSTGSMWSVGR